MSRHVIEQLRAPRVSGARSIEAAGWAMAHRAFKMHKEADQILSGDAMAARLATTPIMRADQTPGTTTGSGWGAELTQTAVGDYMAAIQPLSGAARLAALGERFELGTDSQITFPVDSAAMTTAPWAAEASPIRVLRGDFSPVALGPSRKLGIIVPISRELLKRSAGRQIFAAMLRQMAAASFDLALFSSDAGDAEKHAGLRAGIVPIGVSGDVVADVALLLAELGRNGSSGQNVLIANPVDAAAIMTRLPTLAVPVIQTHGIPAGTVMGIDVAALATAIGEPEFDVSEHAIVHMEDSAPQEIVAAAGPTVSDPIRSFHQTATLGVRMLMDVAWVVRNSAVVVAEGIAWA